MKDGDEGDDEGIDEGGGSEMTDSKLLRGFGDRQTN